MLNKMFVAEDRPGLVSLSMEARLLMERKILLSGTVTEKTVAKAVASMLYLETQGKDPIQLYVNSPGGSVIDGLGLIDVMRDLSCDVHTYCIGKCASMGAVILSSGKRGFRFCYPNGWVMIHQMSSGMQGTSKEMEIQFEFMQQLKANLYNLIADNCGRTFEEVDQASHYDNWMSAEKAKEFGLVDQIVTR